MDSHEIRNRTVSTVLAAFGAAATTATFLFMFQDSNDTLDASNVSQFALKDVDESISGGSMNGPIARGIPKIGDATMLYPDFLQGLVALARNARSASNVGLGWFDNMGTPILVAAHPETAKIILTKTTSRALWGGIKHASEAFFGKSVLFVLEGDEWRRLRDIFRNSFKMQSLSVLSRDVTSTAMTLANRLQEFADAGKPVDMNAAFSQYHLACIGKSSFDYDMDVLQKFPKPNDISSSFEYLLQELPRRSFHPDDKIREDYVSGTDDNVRWQRAAKTVRNVITKAILRRLADASVPGNVQRGDLLDSMINAYHAAESTSAKQVAALGLKQRAEILTDAIGDNLVEVFFAGFNTSVVAMCVGLYHLAKDRELMREAHAEVDQVVPVDLGSTACLSAKQFPFLCRVFQEALRLVTPAPLLARTTTEDLTFDDIRIPTKTSVWIPVDFLHKDPQSWGSTVEAFDPTRWEKPIIPGSFLPFSGGARDCVGKHFAELESVVALAVVLKTYDFDVDPSYELKPLFTGFGTRPANARDMVVCMNVIPKRRTDISGFMNDWTPVKFPRRYSNPLIQGLEEDQLPARPTFD